MRPDDLPADNLVWKNKSEMKALGKGVDQNPTLPSDNCVLGRDGIHGGSAGQLWSCYPRREADDLRKFCWPWFLRRDLFGRSSVKEKALKYKNPKSVVKEHRNEA